MNIYAENILDHYKNPRNKKKLGDATLSQPGVNPLCGDHLVMYLKIENNKIVEAAFEGKGCAISQAAASMLTETLENKTIQEAKKISKDDILEMLGIEIGPTRLKCALLAWDTLQESLKSVSKKCNFVTNN